MFLEPLGEPCCRRAVNDVVIEADRHAEVFTDLYAPVNDARFLGNAAERNAQCSGGKGDPPPAPFPEHPDCGQPYRAIECFSQARDLVNLLVI